MCFYFISFLSPSVFYPFLALYLFVNCNDVDAIKPMSWRV